MELTLETLQSITTGAVSVTQEEGWFHFHRFSKTPESYFPVNSPDTGFRRKVTATSSVKLDFITDAKRFAFEYKAHRASSRSLFFFDLYINGSMVTTHGTADAEAQLSGQFSWSLPSGENRITLYFPNLYAMQLKNISLEGASLLRPAEYSRTMVCYGDSITQGYDAVHPSLTYANRLAFSLNAKMINKGIGGDVFHPELIDAGEAPDVITIAFGTNDWAHSERTTFLQNAGTFLAKVKSTYPDAQVFVITPIWRTDSSRLTACGKFEDIAAALNILCQSFSDIHVIDGLSLTAHMPQMLVDHVHPGELGHVLYGANLSIHILKTIPER